MANGALNRDHKNSNRSFYQNENGLFAMPADLTQAMKSRLILPTEESDPLDDFVYEDQDKWQKPLSAVRTSLLHSNGPRERKSAPNAGRNVSHKAGNAKGAGRRENNRPHGSPDKDWHAYLYVGIITFCFLCMSIITVMMMPQMAGYFWKDFANFAFINGELLPYSREKVELFEQYRDYASRDVIYPGVFVDGISVGDMTIEEAKAVLSATGTNDTTGMQPYAVTVAIGDRSWQIDQSNVPAVRNFGNVLEKAYAIGRTNTTDIQITQQTPFRQRINQLMDLRTNGINLTTDVTYDEEAVKGVINEIAAYVNREPINAEILSFDYKSRTFSFSDDHPGIRLDQELLYERIIAALQSGQQGAIVTTNLALTPAAITKADLSGNFSMIAAYTTDTTSESNRNTNINLACQAINGTALMPGEVFSFNKATGERTTAKGYRSAGAIAAGQSIEEVGGGICQVSSTLFNAAARADLEIVERSPHAWPSTYVDRGEDATVNWPNLDFKFRNNTNAPVFIITYYNDRKMSAEIWGLALKDGMTIDLESKVIRTIEPSIEVKYEQNPELPFGTSQTKVKSRTGYVVETYKVWYQNGQEVKRELLHTSTYNAYQQVVEYN